MKARFCYEVSAEAGLDEDDTGMRYPVYVGTAFNTVNNEPVEIPEEQHKLQHNGAIREMIAQQLDVDVTMLTPISAEEYDLAMKGDDPDQDEEDMA